MTTHVLEAFAGEELLFREYTLSDRRARLFATIQIDGVKVTVRRSTIRQSRLPTVDTIRDEIDRFYQANPVTRRGEPRRPVTRLMEVELIFRKIVRQLASVGMQPPVAIVLRGNDAEKLFDQIYRSSDESASDEPRTLAGIQIRSGS